MKRLEPLLLLLVAFLLVGPANWVPGQIPGDPTLPFGPVTVNLHWQVHTHGLSSYIADDFHGYPFRTDRMVTDGLPLDAFFSAPFCWVFGTATGFWLWLLLVIWAQGMAAWWATTRWWDRQEAGLLGGVGYMAAEGVLRETGEGRYATAFAGVLLPLVLGASQGGWMLAAGALAAMVALVDPSLAAPALFLAFACMPHKKTLRPWMELATGLGVVVGVPLAWILSGLGELPSMSMDPWSPALLDFAQQRPVDLVAARIFGWGGVMMCSLKRPFLIGSIVGVCRFGLPNRWRPLATLALIAALFGLGPYLSGPLVLPSGWLLQLPLLSRAWWSDRWWMVVGLLGAMLAAGILPEMVGKIGKMVGRRGRWVLAGGLFVEAFLSPTLPFGTIPLPPADSAKVLANYPDLPLLLLPLPQGRFRSDRFDLLDQITHGRPLATGTRPPFDLVAPDALLRSWQQNAGLRALAACETGQPSPLTGRETADLLHAGVRMVYIDRRYVAKNAQGAAWEECVHQVLTGWKEGKEQEPFERLERGPS